MENKNVKNTSKKEVEIPKVKKEKNNELKLKEEIKKLTDELKEEQEKSLRIQAEMFNFRKRKEEEVSNLYKYANEDILKKMINIIDNFERALSLKSKENEEFLKGFNMIYQSILGILNENEVKEIICLNEEFNPAFHQAVLTEHQEGVNSNIVIEVLQKGYMYKDKVLRTAMVKVSE